MKYTIKKEKNDFNFIDTNNKYNIKGSRLKRIVIDKNGQYAFFKYEKESFSESCSEKISYEIAKELGYDCAKVELAIDNNKKIGILNYPFIELNSAFESHMDIDAYLNPENLPREKYYKISNIKNTLDELNKEYFKSFIRIMIFDALIGEQDRHEENWGIITKNNHSEIAPLYDNGCSLLKDFKNEKFAYKYYNKIKNFDNYILKSKTAIYKENNNQRYNHFELIEYLNNLYHDDTQKELKNIPKLTDEKIEEIVNKIPDNLITKIHKQYIIMYIIKRKNILITMIDR